MNLPPLLYAAIHWVVLTRHAVHGWSVLLLGSAPLLLMSLMPQGLWWIPGGPKNARRLRALIMVSGERNKYMPQGLWWIPGGHKNARHLRALIMVSRKKNK